MAKSKKVQAAKSRGTSGKKTAAAAKAARAASGSKRAAAAHTARMSQAGRGAERKKPDSAATKNRGLIVFGVIVGLVVVLAVVSKLRQGPPIKLLPVTVQLTYSMGTHEAGPLASPRGIAVGPDSSLYVADLGNHRLVKFGPQGEVADVWGKEGPAAGEFKEPSGVAVDQHGDVYVADSWNGRIQKFSSAGEYYGEISSQTGNFYSPRNVAVDAQGFLYVADTGNSCVKKFDADANLVKRWGEYGTGRERFQETFGICLGPQNHVYVGDAGNRRIKVYTADGKYVKDIRVKGWQSGVGWPMLTVDKNGTVYATDVQQNMVWIYGADGKYLGCWGNKPDKEIFISPLGIAVGPEGSIYVSNMNRGEIIKLAPYQVK
ncbi:NHL repeat-containing protein [candidate division FCPU426 bacterium]|nr:NHL repeat-containing protein [candidate division FCPU426 bacterium]